MQLDDELSFAVQKYTYIFADVSGAFFSSTFFPKDFFPIASSWEYNKKFIRIQLILVLHEQWIFIANSELVLFIFFIVCIDNVVSHIFLLCSFFVCRHL